MKLIGSHRVTALLLLTTLGAPAILTGCGGSGNVASESAPVLPKGKIRVDVIWPGSTSRAIPTNARSVRLQVRSGVTVVGTLLIARPASNGTLSEMPVGNLTVRALAYASTDGSGTPLAVADAPATVTDGGTASVTLTLASTIDHLEYSPNPFVIGAGSSLPLVVTAKDASGNVVLLDPAALAFSSSNGALLSVAADGTVSAGASTGSATLTATEANSGIQLSIPATVAVGVSVTPAASTVNVNGAASFAATVVGSSNTGVVWSVVESGGGTVSASGAYSAPTRRGTYHVKATSAADATRSAIATVTVTSGNIDATVQ